MSSAQRADVANTVRLHLHIDGLALLAGSLVAYGVAGGSWWLFVALLLVPDVFMLGYLAGPRSGAVVYNAGHSLVWPVLLVALGLLVAPEGASVARGAGLASAAPAPLVLRLGLIWAAHIGMDRALGFGYKYASGFNDTDIGRA